MNGAARQRGLQWRESTTVRVTSLMGRWRRCC
jgi:hypothetical protein